MFRRRQSIDLSGLLVRGDVGVDGVLAMISATYREEDRRACESGCTPSHVELLAARKAVFNCFCFATPYRHQIQREIVFCAAIAT